MKNLIFVLLLLLVKISLLGQNPYIRHYTTQDGLPSNTIYQIIQDRNKFIWITSDAGVLKYDGSVFTNFRKKDGLSSNDIVRIKEDYWGRIWLSNYNSSVDFIQNDIIHNSTNTPFLNDLSGRAFFLDFFIDKDSALCFYNYSDQVFRLDRNNRVEKFRMFNHNIIDPQKEKYVKILGIIPVNDKGVNVFTHLNTYFLDIYNDFSFFEIDTLSALGVYSSIEGSIYFTTTHGIYKKKNGQIDIIPFEHDYRNIRDIVQDSKGNLWIDVYNEGVYCLNNSRQIAFIKIKDAHGLLLDDEDNIWISTKNSGIYFLHHDILNSHFIENETFYGSEIQFMIPDPNFGIWFITDAGVLLKHKNRLYNLQLPDQNFHIVSFLRWENCIFSDVKPQGLLYCFSDISLDHLHRYVKFKKFKWYHLFARNFLTGSGGSGIWTYDQNYISRTSAAEPFETFKRFKMDEKINLAFFNTENELVINAKKNYVFKDSLFFPNKLLSAFDGFVFYNHIKLNNSSYLLSVNNDSLYIITKNRIVNLSAALVIPILKQIKKIKYIDNDLYLATFNDVYICHNPLKLLDNPAGKVEVEALPIYFNNINDLIISDDSLYIASNDGLLILSVNALTSKQLKPPIPYLVAIKLNDSAFTFSDNILRFRGEKKIEITIGAINYYDGSIIYSYQMEGSDNKWNTAVGERLSLVYQNLPPGTYRFKVKASKSNSAWSEPLELKIVIKPTLLQHTLFRIFVILFILSILSYFLNRLRISRLRKVENDLQLVVMEQKALQAMMNPHFIFNSLGSIQNFLLKNQGGKAAVYLSDFAKLIRQNLNSLNAPLVSLDEETDRLNNYLNLEMIRLEGKFDFEISVDPELEEDTIYIPGMIVQPFVENAIWHGIATLSFKGKILVSFKSYDQKLIQIIIEDNGIGIREGLEYSGKNTRQSRLGIQITHKRLQLLGEKFKSKTTLKFSNVDDQAEFPGTKVEMLVPFTLKTSD